MPHAGLVSVIFRLNQKKLKSLLFDLLGKKKILELPIDYIAVSIFLFVIGSACVISINRQEIGYCIYIIKLFMIGIIFLFTIFLTTVGFKRIWR